MTDMNINLDKYELKEVYNRSGKKCIFDITKQILRILTPEEEVRQKLIKFLQGEMKIPITAIETEIPVSYFIKTARGRMDILIYGEVDNKKCPIMVIECKAEKIPLLDEVYDQVNKYAEMIGIPFIMVTNGVTADIQYWNEDQATYEQIRNYPTYAELCIPSKVEKFDLPQFNYQRYSYEELYEESNVLKEYENADFIGENCKRDLVPVFVNIGECFFDTQHLIHEMNISNYKFVKDGGIRVTSFGNASGGSYPGIYRFFLIEDTKKNVQLLSMGVFSCINGRTLLIVAIDDFDKHHNSLQLSLEHFSKVDKNQLTIFHDGTLTAGKSGKVKREVVLDYVRNNTDLSIVNNQIQLGQLDCSKLLYCDTDCMKNFISNLITYALVRDQIRNEIK